MSVRGRLRRLASNLDVLHQEMGSVLAALGRAEEERSRRRQAADALHEEVAGLRREVGSLREALGRAEEERTRWREAAEARAAERDRTLAETLQALPRRFGEAGDRLREEFVQVREAVARAEGRWAAGAEADGAGPAPEPDETARRLLEELALVREAVARAEGERASREEAAEARRAERDRDLMEGLAALSGGLEEVSRLLREEVGLARKAAVRPQPAPGGREVWVAAEGAAAVRERPAAPRPDAAPEPAPHPPQRAATVYYFQLEQGEPIPDLDAVTASYAAARMAARNEGGAVAS
jgi:DNA repair exonuclease SbcCD ATPase subunit